MPALLQDVQYALRLFRRQRAFTAVAALVLALGIGATTTVFSLVNLLLLKPLVGHPDGAVVGLYSKDRTQPDTYRAFSYPNFADLSTHTDLFASIAAHNFALAGMADGDQTRRVFVDVVTAHFFDVFGAPLAIGRPFTVDEERPGADIPVTILSDSAWRRLGGGGGVLGRTVTINARPFTVIGVAPHGFGGSMALMTPELWLPTGVYDSVTNDFVREGMTTTLADRRHHNLIVVARLAPAATAASIAPRLDAIGAELARAFPAENANQTVTAAPLSRLSVSTSPQSDGPLTGASVALLAMSGLVLLIACFNLANMLLAQSGARRKELAIRLAIGGSRARIVRQLLTEGLVLSVLGGVGGLVLATLATSLLGRMLAPIAPIALTLDAAPDARVLAAVVGLCSFSTLLFALLPAWKLARTDAVPELKGQAGEIASGRRARWSPQNLLVMGQLAASLVMLTIAGLFLRGAVMAARTDPGFSFDRGVLVHLDPSLGGHDAARSRALYAQVLDRVRARPDVAAASLASIIPFGEISTGDRVQKAGAPIAASDPSAAASLVFAEFTSIGADYFDALGLSIRRGRGFTRAEESSAAGARVAIIDEPLATRLFGSDDPIGRQVQYAPRQEGQPPVVLDVVGVAPGLKHNLFDAAPEPHLYLPVGQQFQTALFVHVRTTLPSADAEAAMLPGLRRLVQSIDPTLPVLSIETMPMFRDRDLLLALVRVGANIFLVFGASALFLAMVGVYGVKSYLVSRRTREIGIRMALGATPGGVVRLILGDGLVTTVVGVTIGAVLSVVAGLGMRTLTFQGQGVNAGVLAGAFGVLAISALVAGWLPARRATRSGPGKAFRSE